MKIPLINICDFQGGTQPPKEEWIDHEEPGYVRMLQIRDFTQPNAENIEYIKETATTKKCTADDILIGRYGASVGKILTGLNGAYNVAIVKTIPDRKKIISRFLYYYLCSPYFQNYILSVGSRAAQAGFNKDDLKNAFISLPDLNEQERVVTLLDKLNALISLRKQQLAKLDELVKARFVEMFGDPVRNNKNLKTKVGASIFKLTNGKPVVPEKRQKSGIPAYGGNGISWYTDEALFYEDTLVIGRVGFQSGNVHLAKGPLWITDNAMYIVEYDANEFDLTFLYVLMDYIDFTRFQDAGDLKKITQKPFMQMKYICPPLLSQKRFVSFVGETDRSGLTIQQSIDKLEVLKKALMQEYFG